MSERDPAPMTARQARAIARAATRELGCGLHTVRTEVDRWGELGAKVPDPAVRRWIQEAAEVKRPLTNGAGFFWTLPDVRDQELLRLLVVVQTLANVLDILSEQDAARRKRRPRLWMSAMVQALDLDVVPDADAPWWELRDGGYVQALIDSCRARCQRLPGYNVARPLLVSEARRAAVLDLEHDPDPEGRYGALRQFASEEIGHHPQLAWWELTAGTCSLLTVLVCLALAADPAVRQSELTQAISAYRWTATLSALLDNYIDHNADSVSKNNNYLTMYESRDAALRRLATLIDRSLSEAQRLPRPERHVLLVSAMIAMFLTSGDVRRGPERFESRSLLASGGQTTRTLVPALLGWRRAHRRRVG